MIKEIKEYLKGENGPIDFNKVIPFPHDIEDGRAWAVANWGTKWNAYGVKVMAKESWKLVIHFQTAWDIPGPILKHLFEKFPDVEMTFVAATEGLDFAFLITKPENGPVEWGMWNGDNDPKCLVRKALFEALNHTY